METVKINENKIKNKVCDYVYFAISNIPNELRAADLRAHFSSLIESRCFICFHYRHRPQKADNTTCNTRYTDADSHNVIKRCCVVQIQKCKCEELLKLHNSHWTNASGETLRDLCFIKSILIKLTDSDDDKQDSVAEEVLLAMPELNPPPLMPNGNVGTPTLVFLDLIQQCLLPQSLVSKLRLKFPKTAAKRMYGNVNFEYDNRLGSHKHSNDNKVMNASTFSELDTKTLLVPKKYYTRVLHSKKLLHNMNNKNISGNEEPSCKCQSNQTETKDLSFSYTTQSEKDNHRNNDQETCTPTVQGLLLNAQGSSSTAQGTISSADHGPSLTAHGSSSDDYGPAWTAQSTSSSVQGPSTTAQGSFSFDHGPPQSPLTNSSQLPGLTNREKKRLLKKENQMMKLLMAEGIEEKLIFLEQRYHDEEAAEEWDICEANEDDPSNQERNKERLYDEHIEMPWEKGGAGVNFYTDAVYWQQQEGDFDEQTTDDLDVDFSAYEEPGTGDKDIKDFLKIRQEARFRSGYDSTDRFSIGIGRHLQKINPRKSSIKKKVDQQPIGVFERHTKGFGRKIMEKQGWTEGTCLGSSQHGLITALKGEGQSAHNKRGLGYIEHKQVYGTHKKHKDNIYISTAYDNPNETDPKEPLLQRAEPSTLKHRPCHINKFQTFDSSYVNK
ncbi:G patch domain-containing protein 3 [Biomphalaria glabrata]|nr:G patch domain-containing protein 3 [Biomphalaria glabrata]KAI8761939.1 G patch domain-containing protein 3-like [Biomphalaria glabrata]